MTLVTVSPGERGRFGGQEEDTRLGSWKSCMGQQKKERPVGFCVINRGAVSPIDRYGFIRNDHMLFSLFELERGME